MDNGRSARLIAAAMVTIAFIGADLVSDLTHMEGKTWAVCDSVAILMFVWLIVADWNRDKRDKR